MAWKGRYVAGGALSSRFVLSFNLRFRQWAREWRWCYRKTGTKNARKRNANAPALASQAGVSGRRGRLYRVFRRFPRNLTCSAAVFWHGLILRQAMGQCPMHAPAYCLCTVVYRLGLVPSPTIHDPFVPYSLSLSLYVIASKCRSVRRGKVAREFPYVVTVMPLTL